MKTPRTQPPFTIEPGRSPAWRVLPGVGAAVAVAASLCACSTLENFIGGDKVDYKNSQTTARPLDVPPDLTQLAKDTRYQTNSGAVSASAFQAALPTPGAPAAGPAIAPAKVGDMHVERDGNQRWIVTSQTPEQLWPQLRSFWAERGFTLTTDQPEIGVMETDWAENRAKLPTDIVRSTLSKLLDSVYSTGERDKFRTRVERTAAGSEIYLSHRGFEEVYTNPQKDDTRWQPRPADPQLEAEFLSRLMARLATADAPRSSAAAASAASGVPSGAAIAALPAGPARARVLTGGASAALQVDEAFDRAWRRVGLALDRTGFTVEDRDRSSGLYYIRYVDPASAGKEEPGFFAKLFGAKDAGTAPVRYRVALKTQGEQTTVSVQTASGGAENGANAQRIVGVLVDDLK